MASTRSTFVGQWWVYVLRHYNSIFYAGGGSSGSLLWWDPYSMIQWQRSHIVRKASSTKLWWTYHIGIWSVLFLEVGASVESARSVAVGLYYLTELDKSLWVNFRNKPQTSMYLPESAYFFVRSSRCGHLYPLFVSPMHLPQAVSLQPHAVLGALRSCVGYEYHTSGFKN